MGWKFLIWYTNKWCLIRKVSNQWNRKQLSLLITWLHFLLFSELNLNDDACYVAHGAKTANHSLISINLEYKNSFLVSCFGWVCRKIRLIEGNANCCHLKKLTCKGTLLQVFICLRPRTPCTPLTNCKRVYSIFFTQGRGEAESWTKEKVRGTTVHKAGSKISTWLTVSPVYNSVKHLQQSPFTDQFS